jgi:hypothetical protein
MAFRTSLPSFASFARLFHPFLTAKELGRWRFLRPGYHGPWWTRAEVALLGRLPDDEAARRTGRSANAVRQKRELLGRDAPLTGRESAVKCRQVPCSERHPFHTPAPLLPSSGPVSSPPTYASGRTPMRLRP